MFLQYSTCSHILCIYLLHRVTSCYIFHASHKFHITGCISLDLRAMIVNHSDVLQASKGLSKVNAIQQMGLSRMGVLQVPRAELDHDLALKTHGFYYGIHHF